MNNPFQLGDLLRIKRPKVTRAGTRHVNNKFSGGMDRLFSYQIEGLVGSFPFGNTLARRRFVVMDEHGPVPQFWRGFELHLYDNYKPEYLGSGYIVVCQDPSVFEKVGKVIDARKLPVEVQRKVQRLAQERNSASYNNSMNMKGMTRLEKVELFNATPALIQHEDPGIAYAMLVARDYTCNECETPFTSTKVQVVHVDRFRMKEIKVKLRNCTSQREDLIHVFPAGYWCRHCGGLSVLCHYKYDQGGPELPHTFQFEGLYLGDASRYLKKNE